MREPVRVTRCAVYTRKSSEEGLEQDFNSLHAQREACEAYVLSQKHEGWRTLPTTYDDGGFSGGSLERPGLKKLLEDIASGLIDVVVVYKVDRLTRSLTDFSRIVEIFDKHGVSFVSVTQAFNTTTSMGRLTLNVLLSFAQFEREVTGERIRDKIAASKKKGMWMGGFVPLGFAKQDRSLVIVESEAEVVRTLYRLYLKHGTVAALKREADRLNLRSKAYDTIAEPLRGGKPFSRGHLYRILANPLYVGEIDHKGTCYPGQHEPIIDRRTWDAVQAQLKANTHERTIRSKAKEPSLLADLLVDEHGAKLTSTHAVRNGKRYRYYVTQSQPGAPSRPWRLPAHEIEALVASELASFLSDQSRLCGALQGWLPSPDALQRAFQAAETYVEQLRGTNAQRRQVLIELVSRIRLTASGLDIELRASAVLGTAEGHAAASAHILLHVPTALERRTRAMSIVVPGRQVGATADPSLMKAIARGHVWFEQLASGEVATIAEIARREKVTDRYVSSLLKLAFLSPELVQEAMTGRSSPGLSAKRLTLDNHLALLWTEQGRVLAAHLER